MKIQISPDEALVMVRDYVQHRFSPLEFEVETKVHDERINGPGVTPTVEVPKEPAAAPSGANHLLVYIYCIANYRDGLENDWDTLRIKMLENLKGVSRHSIDDILDSSVYLVVTWWLTYGTLEGYTTTMAEEIALKLPN